MTGETIGSFLTSHGFAGNTLEMYLTALVLCGALIAALYMLLYVFKRRLRAVIEKERSVGALKLLLRVLDEIPGYLWWSLAVYVPLQTLNLHSVLDHGLTIVFVTLLVLTLVRVLDDVLELGLMTVLSKGNGRVDQTTKNIIKLFVKILVRVLGAAMLLINLGIEITPLLASL